MMKPTLVAALLLTLAQSALGQPPCEKLIELTLPYTSITSATSVAEAPARCEVKGIIRPTEDSEINFALFLPASGWNGKYLQVGNGGWAGNVPLRGLIDPVYRGYAASGTDNGHQGGTGAAWAIGHPEKLIDFGYRAVHETSVQSKAIIQAFYGRETSLNYFVGCSDGGREALMEAQRYPADFNGIIAGAPANNWSHLFTGFIWNEFAVLGTPGSAIPPTKLPSIQNAVLGSCDALDGVKDGLLEDPRMCKFDPSALLCKGTESSECLTRPQLDALKKIYAGPKNPRTGEQIFPGYPMGTEAVAGTWGAWITPAVPANSIQFNFGNTYYGQAVYEDPKWDFRNFDFDRDVRYGDAKAGPVLNSNSPDLRSFRAEGGKLLQYHGWGDAAISPLSSIDYYENVNGFLSKFPDARSTGTHPTTDFYRLFMVPGMGHCGGGSGPNQFDTLVPLEAWVENGIAPEQMIGTDTSKKMTRPICLYPKTARYKGTGDTNDAANFECAAPR